MYPDNSNERRMPTDTNEGSDIRNAPYGEPATPNAERYVNGSFYGEASNNEPVYSNPGYNEPRYGAQPYHEQAVSEAAYNEQAYREPAAAEPIYNPQAYAQPVNNNPVYYSEPVYSEQVYTGQQYSEPNYNEPHEAPSNMYSPGICVNQPYPRSRENGNKRNRASRDNGKGLIGFIRGFALVLACTFFSGSAAYLVMDRRFERGDFAMPPPTQVVLGNNAPERRPDDNINATTPITTVREGMTAEDIYEMARTQVVGINAEVPLFGIPGMSGSTTPISGSGFIISADGYILTNYHVIEIAHNDNLPINVVLSDGTTYKADVIGFDSSNDVALIKIDAQGLNPSIIGNSDSVRVGETIYAIGNPFGELVYTMTDGIVSALDRVVSLEGKSIRAFQFSAAVNSGNSGGPIYNTNGEVIGIVTAKVVRGNVEGIGFAIPINDAIEIASELIEHGYISGRPLLGITGRTVTEANADYFGWVVGVHIRSVSPGSAAETAGMAIGDIITALDGEEVNDMESLRFALRDHRAGETTTITVWRNGETLDLPITFDEDMFAGSPELRPHVEPDTPDPFDNMP